jgi:hypothetical protein
MHIITHVLYAYNMHVICNIHDVHVTRMLHTCYMQATRILYACNKSVVGEQTTRYQVHAHYLCIVRTSQKCFLLPCKKKIVKGLGFVCTQTRLFGACNFVGGGSLGPLKA